MPHIGSSPRDVLVVIDFNANREPYATKLQQTLREMVQSLDEELVWPPRFAHDLNLAIVDAAAIDDAAGRLWPTSKSCPSPDGPFLHISPLCDSPSNFAGNAEDAVACAALQTPATDSKPRPMRALRAIFAPGGSAESSGFRRKDTPLTVVIISAEDDPDLASPEAVAEHRALLGVPTDESDYSFTIGVVAPASAQGLVAFAHSLGELGFFLDIEAESWRRLLHALFGRLMVDWRNPCISQPVADADPATPEIEPDCWVHEWRLGDPATPEVETDCFVNGIRNTPCRRIYGDVIPPCPRDGSTSERCWRTLSNSPRCAKSGMELFIDIPRSACLPRHGVKYAFTCALAGP